jgi:hypothetical protein
MRRFPRIPSLGVEPVYGHDRDVPPALLGPIMIAAIGQVMLAGGTKKRAETALRSLYRRKVASFEQVGEEALDKSVERKPVVAAEILERGPSAGVSRVAGLYDATPTGGRKTGGQVRPPRLLVLVVLRFTFLLPPSPFSRVG